MPIRFRCVYCNQLLGISRRKAGTEVTCANCDGQLIVPDPPPDEAEPDEPPRRPKPAAVDAGVAGRTVLETFDPREIEREAQPVVVPEPSPAPVLRTNPAVAPRVVVVLAAVATVTGAFAAGVLVGRATAPMSPTDVPAEKSSK